MRKGYCGGLGWKEEIWVKVQLGQFGEESVNGGFGVERIGLGDLSFKERMLGFGAKKKYLVGLRVKKSNLGDT